MTSVGLFCWCCLINSAVLFQFTVNAQENYGKFWHVTDFHYDHTYLTSRLSCNQNLSNPFDYGDYWCDSPWKLVTSAINAMATSSQNVDFLLWTGDTVAHIPSNQMNESLSMVLLRNLTEALAEAFPNKTVYAAFGNHDYYPASQFPDSSNNIYNQTAELWKGWIEEPEQLQNFRKGGYYTRKLQGSELRIVVLNTNLYYTSDKATVGIKDPTDQLQWLKGVLQAAKDQKQQVILAAHIPPGVHTPRGVHWYQEAYVLPFLSILKNFTDIIKAMHFGHDHYDGFKVLDDNNGKPAVPIFVAPSVTPWRFKLSADNIGRPHNPSFRLVTYDRNTGDHIDFQQFRMDLHAAKTDGSTNFTLLYSFTQKYKVSDLSASSLDALVSRMERKPEGDDLLDDYYRLSITGAEYNQTCDRSCKDRILCGFRNLEWAEYEKCTKAASSTDTNAVTFGIVPALVLTVILLVRSQGYV